MKVFCVVSNERDNDDLMAVRATLKQAWEYANDFNSRSILGGSMSVIETDTEDDSVFIYHHSE